MKKLKKCFYMSVLILSMAFISMEARPLQANAETIIAPSQTNLRRWFNICQQIGSTMVSKHFTYSNSHARKTFSKALSSNRRSNCARYVSWCLQEYGILSKGQTFYTTGNGSIHKKFKWPSTVSVIHIGKTESAANLKPGDIVCWKNLGHTNIYYGKSSTGKNLYFDAGRKSTRKGGNGSRFVSTGTPTHYKRFNDATISYVIRIKNLY